MWWSLQGQTASVGVGDERSQIGEVEVLELGGDSVLSSRQVYDKN